MRLPETYFLKNESNNLLVSNSLYKVLDLAESQREELAGDFAAKRFAILFKLLPRGKSSQNDVSEYLNQRVLTHQKLLSLKRDFTNKLKGQLNKKILEEIFFGKSIEDIRKQYKLSFDDILFHLRQIEYHFRQSDLFNSTLSPLRSIKSKAFRNLYPREKELISLFSIGHSDSKELAILTGKKFSSVDGDLASGRGKLGLTASLHKEGLRELETMNVREKLKMGCSRLVDFIDDEKVRDKILKYVNDDLLQAGKLIYSFRIHLKPKERKILRMKLWSYSNKEVFQYFKSKGQAISDDTLYRDLRQIKKILKLNLEDFFSNKDNLSEVIDPLKYTLLTYPQKKVLDLYLSGLTTREILERLSLRGRSGINKYISRIRDTLNLTQEQLDSLRKQSLKSQHNGHQKILEGVFPAENYKSTSTQAKTYRLKIINNVLEAMEKLIKEGQKGIADPALFLDFYKLGLSTREIADRREVDISHIHRSVENTTKKLQEVFDNLIQEERPKGVDYGRWLFLDKVQKRIFILRSQKYTAREIIDKLALNIHPASLGSRIKTINKILGLFSE